jgi:hypothetical protein
MSLDFCCLYCRVPAHPLCKGPFGYGRLPNVVDLILKKAEPGDQTTPKAGVNLLIIFTGA